MSERKITLPDLLSRNKDAARDVFRVRPAVVKKWDASTQKADVQPLIQLPYEDAEGERQVESAAIVTCVPVQFPGAGPVRITFPISDGKLQIDGSTIPATRGTLVWSDCSLDKWLSGRGGEVDPEFDHRDGHNDAIFFPGLNPFGDPLDDVPTDHMTIGFDGGLQIKIKNNVIEVGDSAATTLQFVALENLVKNELTKLNNFIKNHIHGFDYTSPSGPASGFTQITSATNTVGDVAAKNLKAEQ